MATLHDLEIRLTGGASNTTVADSFGGALSTVAGGLILSQSSTALTTLTGVTIDDVYGCNEGTATWVYTAATQRLSFQPPGSTAGTAVSIGTTGSYVVHGAGTGVVGTALITVNQALLPGSNVTNTSTIATRRNTVFPDTTKDESDVGKVIYRTIGIQNAHASDKMKDLKVWVHTNTPGQDTINLGKTAAKNTAPAAGASDLIVPWADAIGTVAMTFGDYSTEATALELGDLLFGDYYIIGLRQTVPAGVTEAVADNTFRLGLYVRV